MSWVLDIAKPDNTKDYLKTELGITLRAKQDKNIVESIDQPSAFIAKRSKAINDLTDTKVTDYFNARYKEFIELGLPTEESRNLAMSSAKRFLNEEIAILELQWPGGYQRAFGMANIHHNTTGAVNDLAGTDIGRKAVRQYKRKKRAAKKGK